MSKCNIDHTLGDVGQKLRSQREFLPEPLFNSLQEFLSHQQPQQTLNEIFHLLKKYDLASEEEQGERNAELKKLIA